MPQQPVDPDRPNPAVPGDVPGPRSAPGAPPPGFVPPPAPPPVGVPASGPGTPVVPPNRRLRLVLVMVAGFLGLLCLGGVGVFVSLYDDATEIKRSAPDAVVDNFLIAYLVNRDDAQAALYTCKSSPDLAAVASLREELIDREQEFEVRVAVSWGALVRSGAGEGQEAVRTELTISGSSNGQIRSRRNENWDFKVVDEDGWRVCGAAKVS